MNRLYIVSATRESGLAYGNMDLGLSSPMMYIITGMEDLDKLPDTGLFVHDKSHPVDAVKITDTLLKRGWRLFKEFSIERYMYDLKELLDTTNHMYMNKKSESDFNHGVSRISRALLRMNLWNITDQDFIINRTATGQFYIIPRHPFMEVLTNLFKGYITAIINTTVRNSIEINDPNGLLTHGNSIKF